MPGWVPPNPTAYSMLGTPPVPTPGWVPPNPYTRLGHFLGLFLCLSSAED